MLIAAVLTIMLGFIAWLGASIGLQYLFGVIIPFIALLVFIFGVIWRIVDWARSPVPYSIPIVGGQERSLSWIKPAYIDSPYCRVATLARMFFEVVTFRALFRNRQAVVLEDQRAIFYSSKWLWLAALVFHYSFLVVLIRHSRFFFHPAPPCLAWIETLDSLMQVGVPRLYASGLALLGAALFLLFRRLFLNRVRYISLLNDYFPLCLILGIAGSGLWMRYFAKVDIASVKQLAMGFVQLSPALPSQPIGEWFFVHVFFVSVLLIYIPFSKIMHFSGVFLSSTLNMPNNGRARRHVNPWKEPTVYRTYEEYEDEFRERMEEAGIPVEKQSEPAAEAE